MELEEGSGSSKHSESRPFAIDGSGSSYHYDECPQLRDGFASIESFHMDPEVVDLSSSKNSGADPEIIDENKSKQHTESHHEVIDDSGSSEHSESSDDCESPEHSESHQEMIDGDERSKQSISHTDVAVNECNPFRPALRLSSSSSSSASSPPSSPDDSFRVETEGSFNPRMFSHNPHEEAQTAIQEFQLVVPRSNSSKSEEHDSINGSSTFPLPDVTLKSFEKSESAITSPPIQVMDRSVKYDPLRIPSSVFERSSTELDWSSASNDSLFSIHVGNNSFSRDHICLFNSMNKSREPAKSDELLILIPSQPSPAEGTADKSKVPIADTEIQENGVTQFADKANRNATEMGVEDLTEETKDALALSCKSSTTNQSGSADSGSSFAFPILTGGLKCRSEKADVKEQHLQAAVAIATSKSDFRCCFPTCSCCAWSCPLCRCWCRTRYRWCRCNRHRCCCGGGL